MNKPKLLPIEENFEIPADVQEQMRRIEKLTLADRKAIIEVMRTYDPGEQIPFDVRQRRYIMKSLLRDMQRKKPE